MKLHTTILLFLAAEKQTEAVGFWDAWSSFFGGTAPVTVAPLPPTEPTPTQPAVTLPPVIHAAAPALPVSSNCFDKFARCANWKHQCDNDAIIGMCERTCGRCGGQVIEQPVQVIQKPVQLYQPVYQEPIAPVAPVAPSRPVGNYINSIINPGRNVFATGNVALCADTYTRCHLWKNRCTNKAIQGLCARTCNLCDGQAPAPVIVKPVYQAPQPVYQAPPVYQALPILQPFKQPEPVYQPRPVIYKPNPVIVNPQPFYQPARPVPGRMPVVLPAAVTGTCVDTFGRCALWKQQCGNAAIINLCRKTCGKCADKSVQPPPVIQQGVVLVTPPAPTHAPTEAPTPGSTAAPETPGSTAAPPAPGSSAAPPAPGSSAAPTTVPTEAPTVAQTTAAPETPTTVSATEATEAETEATNMENVVVDMDPDTPDMIEYEYEEPVVEGSGPIEEVEDKPIEGSGPIEEVEVADVEEVVPAEEVVAEVPEAEVVADPSEEVEVVERELVMPLCNDFIINCAEYNNSQYRICDVRPGDQFYDMYRPIQDSCRETCGFCDQNPACRALKEFCHEYDVASTCPGTCAGLD